MLANGSVMRGVRISPRIGLTRYSIRSTRHASTRTTSSATSPPIIRIRDATFYRRQPAPDSTTASTPSDSSTSISTPLSQPALTDNPPIFPHLTFALPSHHDPTNKKHWAVVGPSNAGKTTFLEILRGHHLCFPPAARSWPYLSIDEARIHNTRDAIQYVGFDQKQRGLSGLGTYMAARYESRREATDFSVRDYLKGRTQLNAAEEKVDDADTAAHTAALERVTKELNLGYLLDMPISNLSNGQTRRARIAKALLGRPEVLLLDEPFMGLDPATTIQISNLLRTMAEAGDPRLLLSLRPQDPIPEWISHVHFLGEDLRITHSGTKGEVAEALREAVKKGAGVAAESSHASVPRSYAEFGQTLSDEGVEVDVHRLSEAQKRPYLAAKKKYDKGDRSDKVLTALSAAGENLKNQGHTLEEEPPIGEPVIEMDGVVVKYGDKVVLGKGRQQDGDTVRETEGLFWHVRRGQRWGVFGPNGSGKTTLLSLLLSDHPQSYSLPLRLFGRPRLPSPGTPGIPLFELQRRIGHSSPELHAFFPRHLTVRGALESAFAPTPLSRPSLTVAADDRISGFLRWFQGELNPSAGMNRALAHEYTRDRDNPRKAYVQSGEPELYREAYNEYWYAVSQEAEESVAWADSVRFRDLSFTAQRVLLFLRAIVGRPDVVVLDEAFSGLDDLVRDKCLLFLEHGERRRVTPWRIWKGQSEVRGEMSGLVGFGSVERGKKELEGTGACWWGLEGWQALVCVAHVKEEVPRGVREWLFLPDLTGSEEGGRQGPGRRMRTGRVEKRALRMDAAGWAKIWDLRR